MAFPDLIQHFVFGGLLFCFVIQTVHSAVPHFKPM